MVDIIRVQYDRVHVNEVAKEKARSLNGIAEGADEEYQQRAEETLTNVDMARNRVNPRRKKLALVVCINSVLSHVEATIKTKIIHETRS